MAEDPLGGRRPAVAAAPAKKAPAKKKVPVLKTTKVKRVKKAAPKAKASGKCVAVVGSGPAGLMAAYELAAKGHGVTVIEAASKNPNETLPTTITCLPVAQIVGGREFPSRSLSTARWRRLSRLVAAEDPRATENVADYREQTLRIMHRMFDLLDNVAANSGSNGYPPYNIEKAGENAYRIVMAVAGFVEAELNVTQKENELLVSGQTALAPTAKPYDRVAYSNRGAPSSRRSGPPCRPARHRSPRLRSWVRPCHPARRRSPRPPSSARR